MTPTTDLRRFGFIVALQRSSGSAGVAAYILALTALVLATPARAQVGPRALVTLAAVVYLGGGAARARARSGSMADAF